MTRGRVPNGGTTHGVEAWTDPARGVSDGIRRDGRRTDRGVRAPGSDPPTAQPSQPRPPSRQRRPSQRAAPPPRRPRPPLRHQRPSRSPPSRPKPPSRPLLLRPPPASPTTSSARSLSASSKAPTVITDPAQFPKSFKEAPMLAELVKAGKLPPVEQRVGAGAAGHQAAPRDRQVRRHLAPRLHRPGRLRERQPRRRGPTSCSSGTTPARRSSRTSPRAGRSRTAARRSTIKLRKGMKWSDGEPFTADDFMFWFEDMLLRTRTSIPPPPPCMYDQRQARQRREGRRRRRSGSSSRAVLLFADVLAG